MNRKVVQIRQTERVLQLTWVINNICTNHCDYCPPDLHYGTNYHYDWEKAKSFIERLMARYPKINCAISGGEPTLSPFLVDMIKMFQEKGHSVSLTTNGAKKSLFYWEQLAEVTSNICFSYHPAYPDYAFLNKVTLASKLTNVTIRLMMDTRHWDHCVEMHKKFLNIPSVSVEVVRILTEMAGKPVGNGYTSEQLKWMEENNRRNALTFEFKVNNPKHIYVTNRSEFVFDDGSVEREGNTNNLIIEGDNNFKGWGCNIGLESMYVHYNGWVRKANCFQGGDLFHINDHEQHELPNAGEICFQSSCFCGTDVAVSKMKILSEDHPFIKNNSVDRVSQLNTTFKKKKIYPVIKIIPGE